MDDATVGYAKDIRPLFRQKDIDSMKEVADFDLSSYDDVKANAADIYSHLQAGDMPCDGAWPPQDVQLFDTWMTQGMQP